MSFPAWQKSPTSASHATMGSPGASEVPPHDEADDTGLAEGVSLDSALKYYQSLSELEQVHMQIGGLALLWILGLFSFGFVGLLIMVRMFTYNLHVQAVADLSAQDAMADALKKAPALGASGCNANLETVADASPQPLTGESDGVLLKKKVMRVQRSARPPPVQEMADLGIDFSPVFNGLKVTALKVSTDAVDSDLKVGDIVTIIGEQFTASCEPADVVAAMVGPRMSHVEITAKREVGGAYKKVSAYIKRDIAPRTQEEWLEMWKSSGGKPGDGLMSKMLEPLTKAMSAVVDVVSGNKSVSDVMGSVKSALSMGAGTLESTFSSAKSMKRADQKRSAARATAKSAQETTRSKQATLQMEIDNALADGVITEDEQKAIDAKQASLNKAQKEFELATAAAQQAEADAKAALKKAEAEAQELMRKSQVQAGPLTEQHTNILSSHWLHNSISSFALY